MKYLIILVIFFFNACSMKNYEHTQSKIIIIKTEALKFADLGYIRNSKEAVELELFVAGKSAFKVSINHLICTNDGCMSKAAFNAEYLHAKYPDSILQNILLAQPIYDKSNFHKREEGFEQNIETPDVDIFYKVTPNETYFKDRKNKILFKIKESK